MYVTKQIQNKIYKKKIGLHQRSILREMMSTCDKLGNSFLTKQQQKIFEYKQKEENQMIKRVSSMQKLKKTERYSHDPFKYSRQNIGDDFIYVKQSKEIKQIKDLKQKMLPRVNKTNIERKLKELTYIRNMGYKSKNKKLQSFKLLNRQADEENTINKSWQSFYQDKLNFTPLNQTQQNNSDHIQNMHSMIQDASESSDPKDNIIKNKTENQQIKQQIIPHKKCPYFVPKSKFSTTLDLKNTFSLQKTLNSLSISPASHLQTQQNSTLLSIQKSFNDESFKSKILDLKIDISKSQKKHQPRPIRVSNRNKTAFKQTITNISKYGLSQQVSIHKKHHQLNSDRKKQITEKIGLTKQKLQKQNAFKLYSLIKGGYELDRNDVEGQFISLKRFREAKQNFKMLNTCFKKVKQYRYIVQQPQKVFNNQSFKSLVYLCQIENKLPPSLFKKLQEINKVVE